MSVTQVNSRFHELVRLETSARIEIVESKLNEIDTLLRAKDNSLLDISNELRLVVSNVSNVLGFTLLQLNAVQDALSITFPGIDATINNLLGITTTSTPFDLVTYISNLILQQITDSGILNKIDDVFQAQSVYNTQFANSINRLSSTAFQNVYLRTGITPVVVETRSDAYSLDLLTALDVSFPRTSPSIKLYPSSAYSVPDGTFGGYEDNTYVEYINTHDNIFWLSGPGLPSNLGPYSNTNMIFMKPEQLAGCVDSQYGRMSYNKNVVFPTNSPSDVSLNLTASLDNISYSSVAPSTLACTGYNYTLNGDFSMSVSITYSLGISFDYSGALVKYLTTSGVDAIFSVNIMGQYNGIDYCENANGTLVRRKRVLRQSGRLIIPDDSQTNFSVSRIAEAKATLVSVDYNFGKGTGVQFDFTLPANDILSQQPNVLANITPGEPVRSNDNFYGVAAYNGDFSAMRSKLRKLYLTKDTTPFLFGFDKEERVGTFSPTRTVKSLAHPYLLSGLYISGIDLWMVDANNSTLCNLILGSSSAVSAYVGKQFRMSYQILTLQPPTNVTKVSQISSSQYILQTVQIITLVQAVSVIQSQLTVVQAQITQLAARIDAIESIFEAQAAANSSPWAIFANVASTLLGIGGAFSYASTFVKLLSADSIKLFRSLGIAFSTLGSIAITTSQLGQSISSGSTDIAAIISQTISGIGQILELRAILKSLPRVQLSLDGVLNETLVKDIRKIGNDLQNGTSEKGVVLLRSRLIDTDDLLIKSGIDKDRILGLNFSADDERTALLKTSTSKKIKQEFVDYLNQEPALTTPVSRKYLDDVSIQGEPSLLDGQFTQFRTRKVITTDVQSSVAVKELYSQYGQNLDTTPSTFVMTFREGLMDGKWFLVPSDVTPQTIRTEVGFYRNTVMDPTITATAVRPAAVSQIMMDKMLTSYDEVIRTGNLVTESTATRDLFNFAQTGTPMLTLSNKQKYTYLREIAITLASAVNKTLDLPKTI